MSISGFEALCSGFCELAGFGPPELQADVTGTLAFAMRLRQVSIIAMERPEERGQAALIVAEVGSLPQAISRAGWLALLDFNALMETGSGLRFSRNPRSGDVTLQWAVRYEKVNCTDVYQGIAEMADLALRWRADPFLTALAPKQPLAPVVEQAATQPDPEAEESSERFNALYLDCAKALGQPAENLPVSAQPRAISLRFDEVQVVLAHVPKRRPDTVFAGVRFDGALDPHRTGPESAMEANFVMALEPNGAIFCRDADSAELCLRYAFPLRGADSQACLAPLTVLVPLARGWKAVFRTEEQQVVVSAA